MGENKIVKTVNFYTTDEGDVNMSEFIRRLREHGMNIEAKAVIGLNEDLDHYQTLLRAMVQEKAEKKARKKLRKLGL